MGQNCPLLFFCLGFFSFALCLLMFRTSGTLFLMPPKKSKQVVHTACGTAFHSVTDASIRLHLSAAHCDAMAGRLQTSDTYTVHTYDCNLVVPDHPPLFQTPPPTPPNPSNRSNTNHDANAPATPTLAEGSPGQPRAAQKRCLGHCRPWVMHQQKLQRGGGGGCAPLPCPNCGDAHAGELAPVPNPSSDGGHYVHGLPPPRQLRPSSQHTS